MSTFDSYVIMNGDDGDAGGSGGGTGVLQNNNMRLAFSTDDGGAVYKPVVAPPPPSSHPASVTPTPIYQAAGGNGSAAGPAGSFNAAAMGEQSKRKRGRPRKYPLDGSIRMTSPPPAVPPGEAAFSSPAPAAGSAPAPAAGLSAAPAAGGSSLPGKKPMGRPRGSGKKQQVAGLGSPGVGLTPHIITVQAGEDVSSKIISFSQDGTQVCVLSANGAISNVTLCQSAIVGGTVTYEGRFEILSLSGSFTLSESGGQRSRTGGLKVLLAGPDGRVLGGGVAGLLTAASPVQMVVGCLPSGQQSTPANQADPVAAPNLNRGASAGGSPVSHGTFSESSGGPGSPLNQSAGPFNNINPQGMSSFSWK